MTNDMAGLSANQSKFKQCVVQAQFCLFNNVFVHLFVLGYEDFHIALGLCFIDFKD